MTRFLSESLAAPEPYFRQHITQLEQLSGYPNADIRLSTQIAADVRRKLPGLGLDARDTTPKELYNSLLSHMAADDKKLKRTLQTRAAINVSAEADVIAGLAHSLHEQYQGSTAFALKTTSFKQLMKKMPPKKTMKLLGYRSLDSLLRHEAPALVLAAAHSAEAASWWHGLHAQYKKLTAQDFESRQLAIIYPQARRWHTLAREAAEHHKQTVISFVELGAVVLLPIPVSAPDGSIMATALLALQATERISSAASYLQICQVQPNFGDQVQSIVHGDAQLLSPSLDQRVPWQLIQRSGAHILAGGMEDIYEHDVDIEQASWQPLSHILRQIEPSLDFWSGSEHLALLHEHRAVSMHALDVALNLCNRVPFERRIVQYFQESLWHELLLRYLQPQALQDTILSALQPNLAPAYATS